jgi:hypothetical protein
LVMSVGSVSAAVFRSGARYGATSSSQVNASESDTSAPINPGQLPRLSRPNRETPCSFSAVTPAAPSGVVPSAPCNVAKSLSSQESVMPVLTARAENRRLGPLSVLRAHTNAPYKTEFAMGNAKGA